MNVLGDKHVKYLHIFASRDLKFYTPLVKLIGDKKNGFNWDDTVFLVTHKSVYEALHKNCNMVLDEDASEWYYKYEKNCDWFISHGFIDHKRALLLPKRIQKKIVYRYWGGRKPIPEYIHGINLKNISIFFYRLTYRMLYSRMFGHFAMIGIANLVDEIDLRKMDKRTPMFILPYGSSEYELVKKYTKENTKSSNELRIMIGHSSIRSEKHIYYIDLLQRFKDENIRIYVPISYGDMDYAHEINEYVKNNGIDNVVLLNEYMPIEEYIKLLCSIDIAVLDGETSNALGNIHIHLSFGNTLYVSRTGVVHSALNERKIPHHYVDELKTIDFNCFSKLLPISYDSVSDDFKVQPSEYYIKCWKEAYDFLDSLKKLNK